MAGKWEGFSEDDIQFYLNTELGNKVPQIGNTKQRSVPRKSKPVPSKNLQTPLNNFVVPEEALLLKPVTEATDELKDDPSIQLSNGSIATHPISLDKSTTVPQKHKNDPISPIPVLIAEPVLNDEETLEVFHKRQKILEEQNRQRKDYLAKVLLDRKKQTSQEAKRLQKIQEELHKLDILLSDDISILRDEIEAAAKEFGEAQKRFDRAEKEFLDAKQCLFGKMERKELLTKHLCTIIEQNELRKAQKLSELMEKLAVQDAAVPPTSSDTALEAPASNQNNLETQLIKKEDS